MELEYRPELLQSPNKAMVAGMGVQRQPPSGRYVPGSCSSRYRSCPQWLPWQPCPSNLESFMSKITLFMKKKKIKPTQPLGECAFFGGLLSQSQQRDKKTLKTGKYEQENRKTTFTFALGSSWFKIYLF